MSNPTTNQDTPHNCGSPEHTLHRRMFLQGSFAAGAASVASYAGLFSIPAVAEETKKQGKKCILLWLCGAPSQFETWDPETGDCQRVVHFLQFRRNCLAVQVSQLMPTVRDHSRQTVRHSVHEDRASSEHFQGIDVLTRGDKPRPPFTRPILGSVVAEQLGQLDSPVPQFVLLDPCPEGNEFKAFKAGNWAGWLGAQYGPVRAGGEYSIPNLERPEYTLGSRSL